MGVNGPKLGLRVTRVCKMSYPVDFTIVGIWNIRNHHKIDILWKFHEVSLKTDRNIEDQKQKKRKMFGPVSWHHLGSDQGRLIFSITHPQVLL